MYGKTYQKKTRFDGSFPFDTKPACTSQSNGHLCSRTGKPHETTVTDLSQAERNSIPINLVKDIIIDWQSAVDSRDGASGTQEPRQLLVLDLFCGFGSVQRAVEELKTINPRFAYRACDIKGSRAEQSGGYQIDFIEEPFETALQIAKHQLDADNPAVLVWASTPCETYSQMCGDFHRKEGNAKTDKAGKHDKLNERLVDFLLNKMLIMNTCATSSA
jgi:hypothetical protein